MAWLALVPRMPGPAARDRALGLGAVHVTVHSSRRAVPVSERLGFASSRHLLQTPAE